MFLASKRTKYKKVLLRERKRHTARRVVSTPSVVLPGYPPPGGVPSQIPPRGGTQSGTPRGYPVRYPPRGVWVPPPGGVPSQVFPPPGGVPGQVPPQGGTRSGIPPGGGPGTPPAASWHSGKCCKALWDMGTPPQVWTDKQSETITFPSYYVRGR